MHRVPTYTIGDFVMASPPQFLVMPELQRRARFPFTVDCAERFFAHFKNLPFKFEGVVLSIVIHDGLENLPNHSYAAGWLHAQTLEKMAQLEEDLDPVGSIYFEYEGTTATPTIRVEIAEIEEDWRFVGLLDEQSARGHTHAAREPLRQEDALGVLLCCCLATTGS